MTRKFVVENRFTASVEHDTDPGSWVMVCDGCGGRVVQYPPIIG
jgi:hypothetical protein